LVKSKTLDDQSIQEINTLTDDGDDFQIEAPENKVKRSLDVVPPSLEKHSSESKFKKRYDEHGKIVWNEKGAEDTTNEKCFKKPSLIHEIESVEEAKNDFYVCVELAGGKKYFTAKDRPITFGSGLSANIIVDSPDKVVRQCRIYSMNGTFVMMSLNHVSGVTVNLQNISAGKMKVLTAGDTIYLGKTTISITTERPLVLEDIKLKEKSVKVEEKKKENVIAHREKTFFEQVYEFFEVLNKVCMNFLKKVFYVDLRKRGIEVPSLALRSVIFSIDVLFCFVIDLLLKQIESYEVFRGTINSMLYSSYQMVIGSVVATPLVHTYLTTYLDFFPIHLH
jgi:hypothetical protein